MRFTFLRHLFAYILLIPAFMGVQAFDDKPNIVFIMADDMGYGDVGCYNPESKIPTPNMDRLAKQGIRFTDAHSPSAVCTPTRYGVLTGRYCWRTRLKEGVIGGYSPPLIEDSQLTIASMLKQQGYATACIGKWHLGSNFHDSDGNHVTREDRVDFSKPVTGGPNAVGFDYSWYTAGCSVMRPYGFIENDHFIDTAFYFFENKNPLIIVDNGMMGAGWESREADVVIAEKACDYIIEQSHKEKPFFLYLTPSSPHEPCFDELVPEFALNKSEAGARGDLVWLFDWVVGEVVKTLEQTGELDNTLIIVTSDNGALPGTFRLDEEGKRIYEGNRNYLFDRYDHLSCGKLKGYKSHIWEGGHRIPMIVSWPGNIISDAVSDQVVCLTDMMATLASVTGFDLGNDVAEDSYSFLPVMLDNQNTCTNTATNLREAIIHHSSFGVFSIRQDNWKLIMETKSSGGWVIPRGKHSEPGAPGQLYNIASDPAEANDLWEQEPVVVEKLTRLLEGYQETGRSTPIRKAL